MIAASSENEEILAAIAKRRMTKSSVISLLSTVDRSTSNANAERKSIRDIVTDFCDRATASQTKRVLKVLTEGEVEDSYLKGISAHRRSQ